MKTTMETYKKIHFFHNCIKNKPTSASSSIKKYNYSDFSKALETENLMEIAGAIYCNNDLKICGLNSLCFKKYINEEILYCDFLENSDVEEGIYQCNKCKSRKIFTVSKQTRRGDEATTVFALCKSCKSTWVVNN